MIVVTDARNEDVPDSVLEAKRDAMARHGFVFFRLLGGTTKVSDPAWVGITTWYVDISNAPATTAGDLNDMCSAVFPASESGTIRPATWSYPPMSGVVIVEQAWRI